MIFRVWTDGRYRLVEAKDAEAMERKRRRWKVQPTKVEPVLKSSEHRALPPTPKTKRRRRS